MAGALGQVKWHEQTSKIDENHALQSGRRRRRRRSLRLLLPLLTAPSSNKKKCFAQKSGNLKNQYKTLKTVKSKFHKVVFTKVTKIQSCEVIFDK
jgi:hypothetical protein